MNFEYISELILNDFFTRYTATPYRLNGNERCVDPADSNNAKTLDQIDDFVELSIFPQDTSRQILNGASNGRWMTGFVRFNAFDKIVAGDTEVNGVSTDKLLGVIDTLYSERIISNSNAKITFEAALGPVRVGKHEGYKRFEGFMRIRFKAVFL